MRFQVVPAAYVFLLRGSEVLLQLRQNTGYRDGHWAAAAAGHVEHGESVLVAAVREAEEEIGLPPPLVEVVGTADRYRTVTGFDVTPVVGVVPPDLPVCPAEAEVAAVFEVPLAFLLDHANHVRAHMGWRGRRRDYWEIHWGERRIWGVTAAMIVNLSRRLAWT